MPTELRGPVEGVGLRKILCSKMPADWLKIGLNSAKKIMLLSLRIPLEVNSTKLPQLSG